MRDLSDLAPPPVPSDERIDHAAELLARLSETEALHHWAAAFHRENAECAGVYPRDDEPGDLHDFYVEIPDFFEDPNDLSGSLDRQRMRCRLAICQSIESHDFELGLMRQVIEAGDARGAVR